MIKHEKLRLDQLLVERHSYESRSRARDAILRGCISSAGTILSKPGQTFPLDTPIEIADAAEKYVSRAALKLIHGLEISGINPALKTALDLGASTGGFTQVLLERGVEKVFAVDVGSGQMHPSVANHPKVTNIENLNARELAPVHLDFEKPQILVSDLSFISLKLALPPALGLAARGADGIFLIKPQFEVGKAGLASGGIVRDEALIARTVDDLSNWIESQENWTVVTICPSPIIGGDGNKEFLMIAKKADANE